MLSMNSIESHIARDREELAKAKAKGNSAKVRHYTTEIESLEAYQEHHP